MKKRFLTLFTGALGVLCLTSCGKGPNFDSKTDIKNIAGPGYVYNDFFALEKLAKHVTVGEESQIEIQSLPTQYTAKSIKYESENASIATVSETGVIKGVNAGITNIKIYSEDGKVSTKLKVAVANKESEERTKQVCANIHSLYEEGAGHTKPNKMFKREYSEEIYSKEGVEQNKYTSFETMAYDADAGYFMVQSEDLFKKTAGGGSEKSSGKWIFYAINYGLQTRFIHISETVKRFKDINTGSYENMSDIILDALDMFFSSGRKILNDMLWDYEGFDDQNSFEKDLQDGSIDAYVAGNQQLYFKYHEIYPESQGIEITVDDELNYVNIPTGTKCAVDFAYDGIYEGDRETYTSFEQKYIYKIGEENWTRDFNRSMSFSSEFEMEKYNKPKDLGFEEAETIYDL